MAPQACQNSCRIVRTPVDRTAGNAPRLLGSGTIGGNSLPFPAAVFLVRRPFVTASWGMNRACAVPRR